MALQALIEEKVQVGLEPFHLEVINESQSHHNAAPGAESHFKIIVVSTKFEGVPLLRWRSPYEQHSIERYSVWKLRILCT